MPLTSSERKRVKGAERGLGSAASRWKVLWHLDVWQCQCVCVYQQCVGVHVWLRGGISTEAQSRCCRCEWVFSVWKSRDSSPSRSPSRIPLLTSSLPDAAFAVNICKACLAQRQATYRAKFSVVEEHALNSERCYSNSSPSHSAHHIVEDRV